MLASGAKCSLNSTEIFIARPESLVQMSFVQRVCLPSGHNITYPLPPKATNLIPGGAHMN